MKTTLENIAREALGINTLEDQRDAASNVHEVMTSEVKFALEQAYLSGQTETTEPARQSTLGLAASPDHNVLQIASVMVLTMAARGDIDLNLLARMELAARGLDADGKWVGFDTAKALHNV
jgi:hypothetical protein